jgi:hypothetical protein
MLMIVRAQADDRVSRQPGDLLQALELRAGRPAGLAEMVRQHAHERTAA